MSANNAGSKPELPPTAGHSLVAERRRSTRLNVVVPVILSGKNTKGEKFQEECRTVSINRQGAIITTSHVVIPGADLLIKNPSLGITARARAVSCKEGKTPNELAHVSVKLVDLRNVWGIQYPPRDWELTRTPLEKLETVDQALPSTKVMEVDLSDALGSMLIQSEGHKSTEKARTLESPKTTEASATATQLQKEVERTLERLEEKHSALLALEERLTCLAQTISASCSTLENLVSQAKEIERRAHHK